MNIGSNHNTFLFVNAIEDCSFVFLGGFLQLQNSLLTWIILK